MTFEKFPHCFLCKEDITKNASTQNCFWKNSKILYIEKSFNIFSETLLDDSISGKLVQYNVYYEPGPGLLVQFFLCFRTRKISRLFFSTQIYIQNGFFECGCRHPESGQVEFTSSFFSKF